MKRVREYRLLLYFVKFPQPGKVKTRLAQSLGAEQAACLYRELAEQNYRMLQSMEDSLFSTIVCFDPPDCYEQMKRWLPNAPYYQAQQGNGLGERLKRAFDSAFELRAKQVIALGSDTLGITPGVVEKAYRQLEYFDLVLGPARDGGYYLLGLQRNEPSLFENISWSTSKVFSETVARAQGRALRSYFLETLDDLDCANDLEGRQIPCRIET